MIISIIVFAATLIIATLMIVGYLIYRANKRKLSNIFDDSEIQRIDILQVENVLNWAIKVIESKDVTTSSIQVNVLPNKATLEAFKGQLKIDDKYLGQCYLILIMQSENIISRKLVIPNSVSEELSCLNNNKIFVIPIE